MPPKQRYTREIILNKAFEMFAQDGMSAVNARSVSKALGCSTQPLFSYFPDMNGLRRAVLEKGLTDFEEAVTAADQNSSTLLSHCNAMLEYATAYPKVFLYLLSVQGESICDAILNIPDETIKNEMISTKLTKKEMLHVVENTCIFAEGLACLIASGKTEYAAEAAKKLRKHYDQNISAK